MLAIVYRRYGPPEVLGLEEIEKPVPGNDEVLIKVHSASVNPYDWHFMRGEPRFMRLMAGLTKPKSIRLGVDAAGVIEAVGRNVTDLKSGDEVFGGVRGAFAEYACTRAAAVAKKPANVTFEHAGCATIAGITALQALRDKGRIQAGSTVLVNGASGGVGTFAVQIARSFGAGVTGVCSTRNVDMVRGLGADRVIDYTKEDFAKGAEQFDIVVDSVWTHTLADSKRVVKRGGIYLIIGGPPDQIMKAMLSSVLTGGMVTMMMTKSSRQDLVALGELMAAGKLTSVIDRRYPLRDVPAAIRYLEEGHARGKVVIAV